MPEISGIIQEFLEGNIKTLSGPEPVIQSKTITENGTYTAPEGVDGYSPIIVDVPPTQPVIQSKTITENGTYTAPEGVDGYSPVIVDVPPTQPVIESKTITENGTYTPESGVDGFSPVVVNVPLPPNAYLLKSVANLPQPIASFNDGADAPMKSLKVAIVPQQDLHGYDSPWVGGAGKNKLNITTIKPEKAENGITFTVNTDGTVIVNGTATSQSQIYWTIPMETVKLFSGMIMNGCPSVSGTQLRLELNASPYTLYGVDRGNGVTISSSIESVTGSCIIIFRIDSGVTLNNVVIKPMIRLASVSDSTFAPYSNICPISGWDEAVVTVADDAESPTTSHEYTIDLDGTRYGVDLDVINGIGREYKEYPSYNGETLIGPWISDRDAYAEGTTPTIGAQVVDKGDISTFNTIPTAVKSLRGVNNVYTNTGDITDAEYFSKKTE